MANHKVGLLVEGRGYPIETSGDGVTWTAVDWQPTSDGAHQIANKYAFEERDREDRDNYLADKRRNKDLRRSR